MFTQPQAQRYSNESGLRDIIIAENEVVLTFLLQLLSEHDLPFVGHSQKGAAVHCLSMMAAFGRHYEGDGPSSFTRT